MSLEDSSFSQESELSLTAEEGLSFGRSDFGKDVFVQISLTLGQSKKDGLSLEKGGTLNFQKTKNPTAESLTPDKSPASIIAPKKIQRSSGFLTVRTSGKQVEQNDFKEEEILLGKLPATLRETLHLYERAIASSSCGVVIADMLQPDRPLIYCNRSFIEMTGYDRSEVLGKNCRFLQGPDTHGPDVERLRSAVRAGEDCTLTLLNYRKNGTPFWNHLTISPVRNDDGILTHYIGVQTDITLQKEEESRRQQQLQVEMLLRQVTQRIRSSLDLEQVLATAVGDVKTLLQVDRVVAYRFQANWSGVVVAEAVSAPWTASIHQSIDDTCLRENRGQPYCEGKGFCRKKII